MGIWPDGGLPKSAGGGAPVCATPFPLFPCVAVDGAATALNPQNAAISAASIPVLSRFTSASLLTMTTGPTGPSSCLTVRAAAWSVAARSELRYSLLLDSATWQAPEPGYSC